MYKDANGRNVERIPLWLREGFFLRMRNSTARIVLAAFKPVLEIDGKAGHIHERWGLSVLYIYICNVLVH
jgi:hypothetical protein